ncbi:hypothetical protein PUN28_014044 [Cardiocondyla obscurior]|uniref:Uncharacterized protein n=1 Tax=Cardiocondyla obscurior TaxID=286306 RepID=A0AAW2F8G4_9HYME
MVLFTVSFESLEFFSSVSTFNAWSTDFVSTFDCFSSVELVLLISSSLIFTSETSFSDEVVFLSQVFVSDLISDVFDEVSGIFATVILVLESISSIAISLCGESDNDTASSTSLGCGLGRTAAISVAC